MVQNGTIIKFNKLEILICNDLHHLSRVYNITNKI